MKYLNIHRICCTILLWVCISIQSYAQDPIFSQFYATPQLINPAFTGNTDAPRIGLAYRNQWPASGLEAYQTYGATYDQYIAGLNSGVGLSILSDNAGNGTLKTTQIHAAYGYRIQTRGDLAFKIGIKAGMYQTALDWDRLIFLDQLNPITGAVDANGNPNPSNELRPDDLTTTAFDVQTGFLAYGSNFYGGISLHHLNRPDVSFLKKNDNLNSGLPLLVSLHGGAQFDLPSNNRKWKSFISPNLLIIKQGPQGQINGGAYLGLGQIFTGAWYRHAFGNADAVIALVGWQAGIFKIGYSYDITVSKLGGAPSGGAHELSIVLNFDNDPNAKRRKKETRYNDCFQMFR